MAILRQPPEFGHRCWDRVDRYMRTRICCKFHPLVLVRPRSGLNLLDLWTG